MSMQMPDTGENRPRWAVRLACVAAGIFVLFALVYVGSAVRTIAMDHFTVLHKDQWRIYQDIFNKPLLGASIQNRTQTFPVILGSALALANASAQIGWPGRFRFAGYQSSYGRGRDRIVAVFKDGTCEQSERF